MVFQPLILGMIWVLFGKQKQEFTFVRSAAFLWSPAGRGRSCAWPDGRTAWGILRVQAPLVCHREAVVALAVDVFPMELVVFLMVWSKQRLVSV